MDKEINIFAYLSKRTPEQKDNVLDFRNLDNRFFSLDNKTLNYINKDSEVLESNDSEMSHVFKISSETPDRMGDVMKINGCLNHIENYKKNPVIFFNHRQSEYPIAKSENTITKEFTLWIKDNCLFSKGFWHCKTEDSEKTYELIKLGYLRSASIGFRPIKANLLDYRDKNKNNDVNFINVGFEMVEWDLTEWSVVGIPCNPEALEGMKSWLSKNKSDKPFYRDLALLLPEENKVSLAIDKNLETQIVKEEIKKEPEVLETKEVKTEEPLNVEFTPLETEVKEEVNSKELIEKEIKENLISFFENLKKDILGSSNLIPDNMPVATDSKKKEPPFSVKVLNKIAEGLCSSCAYIMDKVEQIDNPKTKPFVKACHDNMKDLHKTIKKFGKKNYPDHYLDEKEIDSYTKGFEQFFEEVVEESKVTTACQKDIAIIETKEINEAEYLKLIQMLESLKQQKLILDSAIYGLTGK